uniref:Uncharacterized protein n=1 Tax=Anguilla anguilla TaxID=7936 RepID=A0A0E9UUJ6_ANGAN
MSVFPNLTQTIFSFSSVRGAPVYACGTTSCRNVTTLSMYVCSVAACARTTTPRRSGWDVGESRTPLCYQVSYPKQ